MWYYIIMFKSKKFHTCPFYEEHAGEYWQGCWEFNDLCHLAPMLWDCMIDPKAVYTDLSTNGECHAMCPILNKKEFTSLRDMIYFVMRTPKNTLAKQNCSWALSEIINYFNNKSRCVYYE